MEERFVWIIVCVILVDVLWFRSSSNAILPVIVLVLEAVIMFLLAKRMGVDELTRLLENVIQSIGQRGGQGK